MIYEEQKQDGNLKSKDMQIDLYKLPVKELLKWLGWVLFFSSIWFRGCSAAKESDKTTKVKIQAESGTFEPKKPQSKPIEVKGNLKNEIKTNGTAYVVNPLDKVLLAENERLKSDYSKMSDSLKSKAYDKAIELNTFSSKYEDKFMVLDINGIVRGEVQEMTPSYTLKEREADAVVKQTYLRVLGGGSIGFNRDFNQFIYKLDIDFQNRKGDMISGEYLRVNNQDYGMIGFKKSLLNFKR